MGKPGVMRGAALVQFATMADAIWVVENVNNNIPESLTSPVMVKYKSAPAGKGNGEVGKTFDPHSVSMPQLGPDVLSTPGDTVFIGDMPMDVDEANVLKIFAKYGEIVRCKVMSLKPGVTRGAAVVQFATPDAAKWLVENVNNNIPEGLTSPVVVKFKSAPAGKGEGKYGKAGGPSSCDPGPYSNMGKEKGKGKGKGKGGIGDVVKGLGKFGRV